MSWEQLAILITAASSMLAAIGTFLNGRQIEKVHVATNGMKDELVAAVRKEALIEGAENERERNEP